MAKVYSQVRIQAPGQFTYHDDELGVMATANFPLFLIKQAWDFGCDFEAEADGFALGAGTMGDWSAIRDSSDGAKEVMLAKAMGFIFPPVR
jgi:hypothetical protein